MRGGGGGGALMLVMWHTAATIPLYNWAALSPDKMVQNVFLNGNGGALNTLFWWRKCCNYGSWEGHSCVLFEEFSEPDEISVNMCLILQNTLDVTVTALAVQNKREHHNRVKGFMETVVPNYCDPTFASHFRMKRQTFQVKDNPLLTSETVLRSIWPYYFYCEY